MVKLRMSTNILKWTSSPGSKLTRATTSSALSSALAGGSNNNNNNNNNNNPSTTSSSIGGSGIGGTTKRWIHDDVMLMNGHVAYLVKFLGKVEVDLPKGLEVVKESIKKLEFQELLKRSEGEKIKRIELTISIDGVAIRDPKTKQNIHQFPLHRISYCADDKSQRKYLSFITKVQDTSDKHECFVFVSDKLSEEITLTIGQAFHLAYRKYLDNSGREFDTKKELIQAKKRIQELEKKISDLEQKLHVYEQRDPNSSAISNNNHNNINHSQMKPIQQQLQTPPVSPTINPTIDLSLATTRLQSLIDLP